MSAQQLLERLDAIGISLRVNADRLSVVGDQRLLADGDLIASLKTYKSDLIGLLQERASNDTAGIPPDATQILPEMVPLAGLDAAQIAHIVAATPGGVANIQDIYPLAPLQQGILFHHRLSSGGDAYVLPTLLRLDSRARLDAFVAALNEVIARHDILRTCVLWENLAEPMQVVWREAPLCLQLLDADPAAADAQQQLQALADPARLWLDVRTAPLLRAQALYDAAAGCWLLQLLHHHLVLDHTASELLLQEVMLILADRRAELPVAVPFRHFVARTRRSAQSGLHEEFFRRQLGDLDEPTAPFGLLDIQGNGSALQRASVTLDAPLAQRLRRQVRRRGVSAASLLHLAWARVLGVFAGRDDVVFGTVLFGRLQGAAADARAMGMFLNTLPLRLRLDGDSVEQALRRTHMALVELMAHEHAPLALAQRCSAVPANLPLFTSLLNYRHSAAQADAPVLDGIEHLGGHDRTNYPLSLHVDDLGEGFCLTAEVHRQVSADRVVAYVEQALRQLVDALEQSPQLALAAIDAMPAQERQRVLYDFNDTAVEYPRQLLHELVEQQVARTPQAIALRCEERQLSYAALNARANRLARQLRRLGVGPDAKVAVLLERSEWMVIALLAVLKAGGAYVPLDPVHPDERLAHMLDDCAAAAVLTETGLRDRLPGKQSNIVVVDADAATWPADESNLDAFEIGLNGQHLAYVIYTSGSTGKPKGAMNEHRGIVNRLHWMQQAYALNADDVVLQKTPFGFDVSVWEFFWPLMTGAQLLLARPQGHKDPAYLGELIRSCGVTTLHFVPSMLQVFLAQADAVAGCASVTRVVCSGEALPGPLARQCLQLLPNAQVYNLYGPTEAAVDVTAWTCSLADSGTALPIGRPIANTRLYVLDAQLRPLPVGVAGEIYIGGVQVARGYLNKPVLTQERFLADPFVPGGRLYRSGDLGCWREDGAIDYLGRNDFQVKIRGFRIELGEIEAQLKQLADVADAVVVAQPAAAGEQRLVAYVVPASAAAFDAAALRAQLARRLPDYMVPALYLPIAVLPLSSNGKLDRKALPLPAGDSAIRQAFEPPQGEAETLLAQIWSALLKLDAIGRHDSFFELGGHSLLAVQLLEQLRQRGWSVDIRAVFAQPGLAEMAAALTRASAAVAVPANAIPARFAATAANPATEETEEFRL